MMQVRAAVLNAVGQPFEIETLELEPPRRREVLVRVAAAGVCHSDWNLHTGATQHPLPVVPGHEGAGVVEALGPDVSEVALGDHVVLNWAPFCGTCFYCERDRPSLCAAYVAPIWEGTLLDGSARFHRRGEPVRQFSGLGCFAERIVVPEACCVPIRHDVALPVAALIGCAVTTGVGSVLNTARVRPGDSVAVFGVGGVGLSIVMGAQLAGAWPIVAIDRHPAQAERALACGATHALVAGPETLAELRRLTSGRGPDFAFEAVGSPEVQERCLEAVRPGGQAVLVGLAPMGSSTNLPGAILTRQEKSVAGSYYGSANMPRDFPRYADWYLEGRLDLDRLVSQSWKLDDINDAYDAMLAGKVARGVVVFDDRPA